MDARVEEVGPKLVSIEELKKLLNPKQLPIVPYAGGGGLTDNAGGARAGVKEPVNRVPLPTPVGGVVAGEELSGEIDRGGEGGVNLNSTRRAMLMQELSRGESLGRRLRGDVERLAGRTEPSAGLVLSNMFDPAAEGKGFEEDVAVDVREECNAKYGRAGHVFVEKESQGIVYVRFAAVGEAVKAQAALNGRWFGGKKIGAAFVSDGDYLKRFPFADDAGDA